MIRVDYNTTLKELLSAKLMSSETYYSLLSHYRSFSEFTNLADIKVVYNNLKKNNNFPNKSIEEIADIFKLINLSPYISLKELLDNGYISVRTYNVLRYNPSLEYTDNTIIAQIKKDFSNTSDLLKLRNFGKKSFFELCNVFSSVYFVTDDCKNELETAVSTFEIIENQKKIDDYVVSLIKSSYNEAFCEENVYTSHIKSLYSAAEDIHIKIISDYRILFSIYKEFDITGNLEIRRYILNYINLVIKQFLDTNSSNIDIYNMYVQAETELSIIVDKFTYADRYNYFLDHFKKEYIYKYYISLCEECISIRCKHFLEKYLPKFEFFLPYLDKSNECLLNELSSYISRTSKTLVEIIDLCSMVRDKIKEVEICDNNTLNMLSLKRKYPFLVMKQREFVSAFLDEYGKLPHFYVLYQYLYAICNLSNDENQRIKIFCSFYGLFDGVEKTLEEIATSSRLSRERVRQLSTGKEIRKELSEDFPFDIYQYPELTNKLYFYNNDSDFLILKELQNLNFDFRSFAILFCLYSDHRYVNYKGVEIVVSNKIFKSKPLEKILDSIIYRSSLRHPFDEKISVYEFIPKNSKYLVEKKRLLYQILENIIPSYIELEEDHIIFKQNCIQVTTELAKILEEKGEVMFLQDLFIAFKSKYPEHKIETAEKLRPYIKKPLKAIGKQSKYGLETWENIYWGNIRDLLTECLMNSEDPVHIDELLKVVLVHYPNTNVKNIVSTLASDELGRFVQFKGGFYGLERRYYNEKFIKSSIVRRHSFADRLSMFTDFIESYHRFPFSNGGEIEASLQRWYNNVLSGAIEVTDEEISELSNIIDYYEGLNYPKNAFEANFLNKCEDFKTFILENHCLPSHTNGKELYWWLRQSKENMNTYTDKRRTYFCDLLSYISSFGFKV